MAGNLYTNLTLSTRTPSSSWISRKVRPRLTIMATLFVCVSRPTSSPAFPIFYAASTQREWTLYNFGTGIIHRHLFLLLQLLLLLIFGLTRRPSVKEKAWERVLIGEFIYVVVSLLNFASFGRSGCEQLLFWMLETRIKRRTENFWYIV